MTSPLAPNLYWDTCVFVAYLNDERVAYGNVIDDIEQYLEEAALGRWKIYTSTLTIAEIPRARLRGGRNFSSFSHFLSAYRASIIQITPDPNIMEIASDLHGVRYTKSQGVRSLPTPDAIHLASALVLQTTYGVALDAFHTFDNGGKRDVGGRSVPLLTYETWCEKHLNEPLVQQVVRLPRKPPKHPQPRMSLVQPTPPLPTITSTASQGLPNEGDETKEKKGTSSAQTSGSEIDPPPPRVPQPTTAEENQQAKPPSPTSLAPVTPPPAAAASTPGEE